MENEPEVIRQQMDETRTALSDKLDALESKVAQPVNATIEAVTESVENVKESVASVAVAVQDSVQAIRETFDLSKQVEKRPWLLLGGAVAVGYLGGRLLGSPGRIASGAASMAGTAASALPAVASAVAPVVKDAVTPSSHGGSSVLSEAMRSLGDSSALNETLQTLRGLGVGSVMGLLRDMAAQYLPDGIAKSVAESVDDLTLKLGGTKIDEVLPHQDGQQQQQPPEAVDKPRDMSAVAETKNPSGKSRRHARVSHN